MNKELMLIYDDTHQPSGAIKKIVGDNRFSAIIFKKLPLISHLEAASGVSIDSQTVISSPMDYERIVRQVEASGDNACWLHWYSSSVVIDTEAYRLFLEKLSYLNENVEIKNTAVLGYAFVDRDAYLAFLRRILDNGGAAESTDTAEYPAEFAMDISTYKRFQRFITDAFATRFFNSITYDEYTVTKRSENIDKIKKEYTYYYLLDDAVKPWFVQPYDYQETKTYASYTMERLQITDVALKWVHQAFTPESFEPLMEKLMYFVTHREQAAVSKQDYRACMDKIYLEKVNTRFDMLKKTAVFNRLDSIVANTTDYDGLDALFETYTGLYQKTVDKSKHTPELVIGHGDLCFSNILYDEDTNLLKLVDPLGADAKDEAWLVPSYDLAKLSHSVCGRYDFINTGIFDISLDQDLRLTLDIAFDQNPYVEIFKQALAEVGANYMEIRLYEASLFLSMLPLHTDKPKNMLAYILTAMNIIKELENA